MKRLADVAEAVRTARAAAGGLVPAAASLVRTVAGGPAAADLAARRFAICQACPHLDPQERCRLCGCPMRGKTRFRRATCPDQPPRWT